MQVLHTDCNRKCYHGTACRHPIANVVRVLHTDCNWDCYLVVVVGLLAGLAGSEEKGVQVGPCCLGWALTPLHQPTPQLQQPLKKQ